MGSDFSIKLREKIVKNKFINLLYNIKFYFDVSVTQITWLTGKLPEIMAFIYILEKFGYYLNKNQIIMMFIFTVLSLIIFGFVWKITGMYDVERYVDANKNPVSKEMLEAARKINKKL